MTNELNGNVRKISGKITELKKSRRNRDFVLSQIGGDVGASAVSAALAGMGGAGIAIASIDSSESADFVEFSLNGEPVQGWFWRFPFQEGDDVELVAERGEGAWSAYGVRRESDSLVAVYPHCFEGRRSHYLSTFRFWGIIVAVIFGFMMCLDAVFALFKGKFSIAGQLEAYGIYAMYLLPALLVVFGFLAWRAGRKTEGFAHVAEMIFKGFGWSNPTGINLRAISKTKRRQGDGKDYGLRYFRY
ncbi:MULTISPECIES: putative type VI secretion system effector [Achromobacter]|jgi:hypothetical protein|uniref:Uncharacterized protein n=1 Tax=Alcaligenes xylosoxydans xylosoxydans TaxID=85698 RepID=A0A424WKU7_ALCXX|nr:MULTISPECIES: putative type VI secretion system effector [Achromobacter]MBC9903211.1 hypothetical protein [Achromobacter xylosoxidans]MBD0867801.1 hypothetical protein [Achromobacter xylosoxidans]MDH1301911.1 hypothetical protein [Achromobacter sp. GD03932]QNP86726.1 hypothetical protein IAG39_04145 [Achromobacter xylosoxidans]RPJ93871.1 hypothetical protein DY367_01260 [Achromobacter xylosoxidans]